MPGNPPRYERMAQFFAGAFGENIYTNTVLLGPSGPGKTNLLSYLALYANGDLPYAQAVQQSIFRDVAHARVLRLSYPEEAARSEAQNARAVVKGEPAQVDETIWRLGVRQTDPLGLPVIFVTWMRRLADGQPQITLWYPSMTVGRWALARIKQAVREY